MPAIVTSSGIVTWRSTSSADAPGNLAMTSTMAGAGSGYASTLTWTNAYAPNPTSAQVSSSTMALLLRAHWISLWTIVSLTFEKVIQFVVGIRPGLGDGEASALNSSSNETRN